MTISGVPETVIVKLPVPESREAVAIGLRLVSSSSYFEVMMPSVASS